MREKGLFWAQVLALSLSSVEGWIARNLQHGSPVRSTAIQMASSDRNVVLAPSDNPSAFDSFKIGNARVHRYSREEDPECETEYVMWYHGRSKELDGANENKLPPLSTGRIGRATSRNGLVWEKDTKGSVSEDITGVSLGLNTAEWWGFDTAHVGLGNVLLPMTTPGTTTSTWMAHDSTMLFLPFAVLLLLFYVSEWASNLFFSCSCP